MERPRALRAARCILRRDAERGERLGRSLERLAAACAARKQPVIALDMQPVPVTVASSAWPFDTASTRSPSHT